MHVTIDNQATHLDVRPWLEAFDAGVCVDFYPWKDIHVRDGILSTPGSSQPIPIGQANVQDAIETPRLLKITWTGTWPIQSLKASDLAMSRTVDGIRDLLWGIYVEVVCLALHGTNTSMLRSQPFINFPYISRPKCILTAKKIHCNCSL